MLRAKQKRYWVVPRFWLAVLLAGCASLVPTPNPPWQPNGVNQPAAGQLRNYAPSATGQADADAPAHPLLPGGPVTTLDPPPQLGSLPTQPTETAKVTPDALPAGPRIVPEDVLVPARLELQVDAPRQKQVGSRATFRLTIHNGGNQPAENVAVESEFEESLNFPGKEIKKVRQEIGRIVGGESKQLSLTLTSDDVGSHCSRFTVMSGGREAVWKSVCIEFLPKRFTLKLVGPSQRTVGSRAEFTAKLINTSAVDLEDVRVSMTYDSVLSPREASSGALKQPGALTWNLGTVKGGEGLQLQVEFDCGVTAENACLFVNVAAADVPPEEADACLAVVPVKGILDVQVEDRRDGLKIGDETSYLVTIQNRGLQGARDIRLVADVPDGMRVVSSSVQEGEQMLAVASKMDKGELVFDAVPALRPDGVLAYEIHVKAVQPGDVVFRARVTHAGNSVAVTVPEMTTINP